MTERDGASSGAAGKTIAAVRILTGIIFLFFGEYKIAGPEFAHGGLAGWVNGWLGANEPVAFYGAFLRGFVLPHQVLCARIVGWGELAIGIALVLGLFVRAASVGGAIHMVSLALATWYAPGHGAATWKYFGANLDHILIPQARLAVDLGGPSCAFFVCDFLCDEGGGDVGSGWAAFNQQK